MTINKYVSWNFNEHSLCSAYLSFENSFAILKFPRKNSFKFLLIIVIIFYCVMFSRHNFWNAWCCCLHSNLIKAKYFRLLEKLCACALMFVVQKAIHWVYSYIAHLFKGKREYCQVITKCLHWNNKHTVTLFFLDVKIYIYIKNIQQYWY